MIKKNIHMCDQIPNRIDLIMQENKLAWLHQLEEFSIVVLLVATFIVGVGF